MGLTQVQNYIIGIILAMVMVTCGLYVIGTFVSHDSTLNSARVAGLSTSLDKSQNVTSTVASMQSSLTTASTKGGALGWLDVLIGSAWNGLKLFSSNLGFMTQILTYVGELFGLPSAISGLIVLIAVVIIIFAIWMAIMRVYN